LFDIDLTDFHLSIYNYGSKKYIHANYKHIEDNQFLMIGDLQYGSSE